MKNKLESSLEKSIEEKTAAEKRVDKLINGRTTLFKELIVRYDKSPHDNEKLWIELEKVLLKHQHLLPESKEEKK